MLACLNDFLLDSKNVMSKKRGSADCEWHLR